MISGPILAGDTSRFSALMDAMRRRMAGAWPALALDSPGGNVLESRVLAALVAAGRVDTVVAEGATCASGCAIVFFAGERKIVGPSARIGLHRAATPTGIETASTLATSWDLAKALRATGSPQRVIDKLMDTPPGQMTWLTADDMRGMPSVSVMGAAAR